MPLGIRLRFIEYKADALTTRPRAGMASSASAYGNNKQVSNV